MHQEDIVDVRVGKRNWAPKSCCSGALYKQLAVWCREHCPVLPLTCGWGELWVQGTAQPPPPHTQIILLLVPPHPKLSLSKSIIQNTAEEEFSILLCRRTTAFSMLARTAQRSLLFVPCRMPLKMKWDGSSSQVKEIVLDVYSLWLSYVLTIDQSQHQVPTSLQAAEGRGLQEVFLKSTEERLGLQLAG